MEPPFFLNLMQKKSFSHVFAIQKMQMPSYFKYANFWVNLGIFYFP